MTKFRDAVNVPHKKAGKARQYIAKKHPKNTGGKVVRGAGVISTGLAQFLLWLTKYAVFDNPATRKMERQFAEMRVGKNKQGNDKKIPAFLHKRPELSSYLVYWMAAALLVGGAVHGPRVVDKVKEDVKNAKLRKHNVRNMELTPKSETFMDDCKRLENVFIIPMVYTETYRETPLVQAKENVYTHGWGMTWSPDKNGRMLVRDYADTKENIKKGNKPHEPVKKRTKDSDIEESQQFLIDHIYPKIQNNITRTLTQNEFIAICIAGYQLEGHIPQICQQLDRARTTQEIADAFITPTMYRYGGTPKRRWVCAMIATGLISYEDILDADIDAFYDCNENTIMRQDKNGTKHFKCGQETIEYVLGLRRGKSVRDMVKQTTDGRLALAELSSGYKKESDKVIVVDVDAADNQETVSMKSMIAAQKKLNAGDLVAAAQLYEQAIEQDADNIEAYSSLSLVYKKLGDKEHSIEYYQQAIDAVKAGTARINANRKLLNDPDVKASAYYNAGCARREIAIIHENAGDMNSALQQYKLARQNFVTAHANAQEAGKSEKQSVYENEINKTDNAIKSVQQRINANKTVGKGGAKTAKQTSVKRGKKNGKIVYTNATRNIQSKIKMSEFMRGALNSNNNDMA